MRMTCRSCVEPKLVSKGWRSRIRSSRISICLINTRCSGDKQVFIPLVCPLEISDEVILRNILEKLLTDAQLNVPGRLQALLFERLDIGWNKHMSNITLELDSRLLDPPLCDEPVAFQSLLQRRGCGAVKVHIVTADDCA